MSAIRITISSQSEHPSLRTREATMNVTAPISRKLRVLMCCSISSLLIPKTKLTPTWTLMEGLEPILVPKPLHFLPKSKLSKGLMSLFLRTTMSYLRSRFLILMEGRKVLKFSLRTRIVQMVMSTNPRKIKFELMIFMSQSRQWFSQASWKVDCQKTSRCLLWTSGRQKNSISCSYLLTKM